jgi:hypothetical protein
VVRIDLLLLDFALGRRVHRNYLDVRFCPVTWLLTWLSLSGITSGPIFQRLGAEGKPTGKAQNETIWQNMTQKIFIAAGLYLPGNKKEKRKGAGCTNHSIRRSAAQWAGRCGAGEQDCANNGRWKTWECMAKYLAAGSTKRRVNQHDRNGEDPIFKVWVWKPVVVGNVSGNLEL